MNFFNIGPTELLFILVLALIIFGPGKLPEVAKGLGKAVSDFRRASQGLTQDLAKELTTAPAEEDKAAKAAHAPAEAGSPSEPQTPEAIPAPARGSPESIAPAELAPLHSTVEPAPSSPADVGRAPDAGSSAA